MHKKWVLLVFALVLAILTDCKKSSKQQSDLTIKTISFRDIPGVTLDKAMPEPENTDYEEGADLVKWLKERIIVLKIAETAERLMEYEKELST